MGNKIPIDYEHVKLGQMELRVNVTGLLDAPQQYHHVAQREDVLVVVQTTDGEQIAAARGRASIDVTRNRSGYAARDALVAICLKLRRVEVLEIARRFGFDAAEILAEAHAIEDERARAREASRAERGDSGGAGDGCGSGTGRADALWSLRSRMRCTRLCHGRNSADVRPQRFSTCATASASVARHIRQSRRSGSGWWW